MNEVNCTACLVRKCGGRKVEFITRISEYAYGLISDICENVLVSIQFIQLYLKSIGVNVCVIDFTIYSWIASYN